MVWKDIDAMWKRLDESHIDQEVIEVREKAIEEIGSKPGFMAFIEVESLNQILPCFIQDLDLHDSFL